MLDKLTGFADDYNMLPGEGLVLVCVSGGADSMCLLEALLRLSPERGFKVGVLHFNHKLRGEEADRDELFVKNFCESRGTPFYCGHGDVRSLARAEKTGIEDAARKMRYKYFLETAKHLEAVRIATAHTADDNAETVIMNIARGSGLKGLGGIPPVRGGIIRPMLRVTRKEVLRFLEECGVSFAEDSTNKLDIYTRNRVRSKLIPVLKEINPRFTDAVYSLTSLLRADEEYLSGIAEKFVAEHSKAGTVNAERLYKLPFAVSSRVIRRLYGESLSHGHVKAVLELCRGGVSPSARLSLPEMTVYREYDRIVFSADIPTDGFKPVLLDEIGFTVIPELGYKISCKTIICGDKINKSLTSFLFKSADICGKIAVRPRREGDIIKLNTSGGSKTLKKLFIERRIPRRKRLLIPVLADDSGVLAIYGIGAGDRARPEPGALAVKIEFEDGLI